MNVVNKLDHVRKIKNRKIKSVAYRINKLLLNSLYPVSTRFKYGIDEKSDIIISLTSFPARINTVWITIQTLLNQTVKPKKLILWLAEEQFINKEKDLPHKLLKQKEYGLTIKFCDDLRPHKKYFYAMQQYPKCAIITVDDDIFYPETLVEELQKLSKKYPDTVCCTWAHEITFENGEIAPYGQWSYGVNGYEPNMKLIPIGCGGVLYPASILPMETYDKETIKKICLNSDDLWLKGMSVLNDVPAVRIRKEPLIYYSLVNTKSSGLYVTNIGQDRNDIALRKIIEIFPKVNEKLLYK
ncbi:glycosyltransferase [Lacrimispora amygdalina]|uniref:glycosyltransferase n=1 Tax=Lacrimispora amygdalina TaxID=253257 RepID=UPI000BE2C23B|nr:glycosyltransferase [Lacrimispora amygdalina]